MKLDIQTFLQKHIDSDEKFILACSTGPDSMFLLHQILKTDYKKNMVVAYFNHKIRKEADDEEKFIEELGKKEGFAVEIGSADIRKIQEKFPSRSLEEIAREKRYQFFDALLHIHTAKYVITGHHLDDKIETFFFNLVRGSKLTGLINMTGCSGNLLRPLLDLQKKEIEIYMKENKLVYAFDNSNTDTDISRNNLRINILPEFEKLNSNYKGNVKNLMSYFEEVKDFLDEEVQKFIGEEKYFEIQGFQSLSILLQKEIIRHIYYISNSRSTIGLSEGNIAEVLRFINGKNNKTIKEIHGLKMRKDNTKIFF